MQQKLKNNSIQKGTRYEKNIFHISYGRTACILLRVLNNPTSNDLVQPATVAAGRPAGQRHDHELE